MSTKTVSRYKNHLTMQVENLLAVSHFIQHKTFSALNYAEDFGNTVKESLKRTRNSKRTNTLMVLSAVSTVSPIGANDDKRR